MKVSEWARRLRSANTREIYTLYLNKFLEYHQVSAEGSLEWSADEATNKLESFMQWMIEAGYAGATVGIARDAARRWFLDHRIRLFRTFNVSKAKTYLDYIPSKEDISKLLNDCSLRYKAAISLIAFAGLRPVDVRDLQYKNVKNSIEAGEEIITIMKKHQKTQQWYAGFLGPQGANYLRQVISRHKESGILTDDCFVISKDCERISKYTFLMAIRIIIERNIGRYPTGEEFRRFRPYGLRKYFRRAVDKLGESTAEYLMGHQKGLQGLEATYSGLRDLDNKAVERLREKYKSILPELETELTEEGIGARLKRVEDKEDEIERLKLEMAEIKALLARARLRELDDDEQSR